MGATKYFNYIKKKRVTVVIIVLLTLLMVLEAWPEPKPVDTTYVALLILIIMLLKVIEIIQREQEDEGKTIEISSLKEGQREISKRFNRLLRLSKSQEIEQKKTAKEQKKTVKLLKEQIEWNKKYDKKTETTNQFISELIDRALITYDDVYDKMEGINVYILYCYATRYLPRGYEIPYDDYNRFRKYPEFLKDLGFVRLRRQEVFITTESRIKPKFREVSKLKKYLLEELDKLLKEEWETLLKDLSKSKDDKLKQTFNTLSKKEYSEVYKLNILLIRSKFNENNLGYLHEKIFPKPMRELFELEVIHSGPELSREKKARIKDFVVSASFEHVFEGVPKKDLEKLSEMESRLKDVLEVDKITDYSRKSKEDIIEFFSGTFPKTKAKKYGGLLWKRSNGYKEALKKIGISS